LRKPAESARLVVLRIGAERSETAGPVRVGSGDRDGVGRELAEVVGGAITGRHSARQAANPRRVNRLIRRLRLICPKMGSILLGLEDQPEAHPHHRLIVGEHDANGP
jgi:hypothetical protein